MTEAADLRCSDATGEPLPGSAKQERVYVILEWPHGWSRDVLDGGVFGEDLTTRLKKKLGKDAGLQLIRHPGRDGRRVTSHHLFLVFAEEARVEKLMVEGPEAILDLDLSGPGRNNAEPVDHPLVLVCTHGKRDVCCALKGRPLAAALSERHPGTIVWETSHTKGHRFAPSILLMPWGYSYGRLNEEAGDGLVRAALRGEYFYPGNRGRGLHGPRGQVAELAVARELVMSGEQLFFGNLTVLDDSDGDVVVVHADGRSWQVVLEQRDIEGVISSCGDAPKTGRVWVATDIRPDQADLGWDDRE
ncbi:sucrase ferredoxin [Corynebacterium sp.]|uniref:sucrase ferredoxin n=1 Tax=Corynebacterium sp. TaxID=1720 RepID=UPI0026E0F9B7|nr:sucrase ferredoxin [Corynebacterium sp.]MDO5511602.1 sucrase ferredoxin [Corynebacterium sp.]